MSNQEGVNWVSVLSFLQVRDGLSSEITDSNHHAREVVEFGEASAGINHHPASGPTQRQSNHNQGFAR